MRRRPPLPWNMFMTADRTSGFAAVKPARSNHARNPGLHLNVAMFEGHGVHRSAAQRRGDADDPAKRKGVLSGGLAPECGPLHRPHQAGRQRHRGTAQALLRKARQPLAPHILKALDLGALTVGAVCVYPTMVSRAVKALRGTGIPGASVATGFPAGVIPCTCGWRRSAGPWTRARARSISSSPASTS